MGNLPSFSRKTLLTMKPILILAFLPLFHCASAVDIQPEEWSGEESLGEDPNESTYIVFDDIDDEDNFDEDSLRQNLVLNQFLTLKKKRKEKKL
eukprot:TRINITY_DN5880_c0_g1_i2.p5 TRINITY_DN5880_c0_g1~~TRINITY_DN5880_c0_g1_i2.p5  ORF type:complete len:102 (-),score=43.38 TRINITY_DN5880_c0_g1_i2:1235-1516(-)